jgi:hypothetical protein
MKISPILFVALLLLSSLACTAIAAEPEPAEPAGAGQAGQNEPVAPSAPNLDINQAELKELSGSQAPVHPDFTAAESAETSPLMQSIRALTAAADAQVAEMQVRLDAVADDAAALEILRAMERVKVQTELDILAVQAAHARRTGREELAGEIESAIRTMTEPRPAAQPVMRAAPDAVNR